jgi:UDP-2,3-diacylglucosamine pyrophosphatase LpxH
MQRRDTNHGVTTATHNLLVVSDLHFGEELLPGTSVDKRQMIELGARCFCDFLSYHQKRREGGRPWHLVIAGDLFDFMSLVIAHQGERRSNRDIRLWGASRSGEASVTRMDLIAQRHRLVLQALITFAHVGHKVDIVVGNHDVELLDEAVVRELSRHLLDIAGPAQRNSLARIRVSPWFVYVPGTVWIEHGHQYDEACSFEFAFAPCNPASDDKPAVFLSNADYAAVRYLATTAPQLDAHGAEQWSIVGYMRYAYHHGGLRAFVRSYGYFVAQLWSARHQHRRRAMRDARRQQHERRLADIAAGAGIAMDTARALDRLGRAPLTTSTRRLASMLALDIWAVLLGAVVALVFLLLMVKLWIALPAIAVLGAGVWALLRWLSKHHVSSQLPMRRVPERIGKLVDAPFVLFGHTHDPLRAVMPSGVTYLNCGTWLPATRPGLRRSFTFVRVAPASAEAPDPRADILQWHNGSVRAFVD